MSSTKIKINHQILCGKKIVPKVANNIFYDCTHVAIEMVPVRNNKADKAALWHIISVSTIF